MQSNQSKGESEGFTQEDLDTLKAKTRQVEELGMKIDESIKIRQDTEILIQKLGAYDSELFEKIKGQQL